jgi:cytochrome P450
LSRGDAFAALERAGGIGIVFDFHDPLAQARIRAPVHETTVADIVGAPELRDSEALLPDGPRYVALTYDAVTEVLRDSDTWSSATYADSVGAGRSILLMDEPEHRRYRNLTQAAFTPAAIEPHRDRIEAVVNEHLDMIASAGRTDLMNDLTSRFPIALIASVLGLAEADVPRLEGLMIELITGTPAPGAIRDCFAEIVARRRAAPAADLVTALVEVDLESERLTDDEIFAFLRTLLPASTETTFRATSNLLYALLAHPDQLDAVRNDRSLVPAAVEESLRWESSPTMVSRTAVRDTEVAGTPIPAGARMATVLASANRDDARWARPESFDIRRPALPHVAFASGPHMCLGVHLARLEMAIALEAVLDRLRGLRFDPDVAPPRMSGLLFRSPNRLPVRFDPS